MKERSLNFETLVDESLQQLSAYADGNDSQVEISTTTLNPTGKEGIVFEVGTTDFDEAVQLCERIFADCTTPEWEEVKASRDFSKLSTFLTESDVDNKTFRLR